MVTNSLLVALAISMASVVLPVPGGPHRITDDSRSASIRLRSGLPGEDGGEAVDAEGEPGVGRGAVAEGVEQEPEAGLRLLGADPEQGEHALLDIGPVDSNAARAQLPPVEHEVVRQGADRERIR